MNNLDDNIKKLQRHLSVIKEKGVKNNIFFAGAWNGYGFHEDGVKSALNIANKLTVDLSWVDKNEKSN